MKNYIISLTHDLDQALKDNNTIKKSIDPENMFEGIPTSSLTMITKEELDRKKEEDIFKGTRTIAVKNETKISKILLIATDGSLIQSRSRRVATSAIIFGENSILNSTEVCTDSTSSTTPEIMAIFAAQNKMVEIGLKNSAITSNSVSAINYVSDLLNSPMLTKSQSKIASAQKLKLQLWARHYNCQLSLYSTLYY